MDISSRCRRPLQERSAQLGVAPRASRRWGSRERRSARRVRASQGLGADSHPSKVAHLRGDLRRTRIGSGQRQDRFWMACHGAGRESGQGSGDLSAGEPGERRHRRTKRGRPQGRDSAMQAGGAWPDAGCADSGSSGMQAGDAGVGWGRRGWRRSRLRPPPPPARSPPSPLGSRRRRGSKPVTANSRCRVNGLQARDGAAQRSGGRQRMDARGCERVSI